MSKYDRMLGTSFEQRTKTTAFLPEGLHYTSANSKGTGETALMRRLARASAGRLNMICILHVLARIKSWNVFLEKRLHVRLSKTN